MEQAQISKVRASVHRQRGNRVKIQLDRGRNKVSRAHIQAFLQYL